MEALRLDRYLTSYTKINSKWIQDLNIRANTIKLLEENIRGMLHDTEFGNDFMNTTQKEQATINNKNRQVGLHHN